MPRSDAFPYPASPRELPSGYADYSDDYKAKQRVLLIWAYCVFMLYIAMLLGSLTAIVVGIVLGFKGICLGFPLAILAAVIFAYLLKSLFYKQDAEERQLSVEITEDEHPKLFGFVQQLCDEIGVSTPAKIHVLPEPNAAAMEVAGLKNLFVPPEKELFVGIGLINALNLSEFKAVLAHEFGHFAQYGYASVYTRRAAVIVSNLIVGQDGFERMIRGLMQRGNVFGFVLFGLTWAIKWPLWLAFKLFAKTRHQLAFEAEFHSDRVGASMAGSNAMVHSLYRVGFASETYGHAIDDLKKAADHDLFTADLYYHQHAAGDIIRRKKRDPQYGLSPKFADPAEGRRVQIFREDEEEDHDDEDYHPPNHEREENVKSPFVPADEDERSAWILFDNPTELREKMTYKVYRRMKWIRKGTALDDPKDVQKFIDDEHYETTYDARYEGAYDDRLLNPGRLDELDDLIAKEPWEDARLAAVYGKLYKGLDEKVEDRKEILADLGRLRSKADGATSRKIKRKIKDLERDLEKNGDWFRTLDRRVYLISMQMAYRVEHELYYDLFDRYRFHMVIQGIYKTAAHHDDEATFHFIAFNHLPENLPPHVRNAFVDEVLEVFREARKALRNLLRETKDIDMPALKNFEEGENLAEFLLGEDLIRDAGEQGVTGKWINKLFRQIGEVRRKAARLHGKSLGQILALQERAAREFLAKRPALATSGEAAPIFDD